MNGYYRASFPWPLGDIQPIAERPQDNWHANDWFVWPGANGGPRRNTPREPAFRERDPFIKQWRQGDKLLPHFRPKLYFTRPHDGKRPGFWGRVKDACTDEGADVFVTSSGDKRTLMRDRPQRWQWSGWTLEDHEVRDRVLFDKDCRWQDIKCNPMNHRFTERRNGKPLYNFRNRKHESIPDVFRKINREPDSVWKSAVWPEGAKHASQRPLCYQDGRMVWWSRVEPWAGIYPGGRPKI